MRIQDIIDIHEENNKKFVYSLLDSSFELKDDKLICYITEKQKHLIDDFFEDFVNSVESYIKKKVQIDFVIVKEESKNNTEPEQEKPYRNKGRLLIGKKLKKEYTFDTFITGQSNRFAINQINNFIVGGENTLTSLYLFGKPGVGKTHLAQATAHELLDRGLNIVYFDGKDFINFVQKILRDDSYRESEKLEKTVLSADALFIDDLQYIEKKVRTQEELKYFIDKYNNEGKRFFFVANKSPKELNDIIEPLKSRLVMGYVAYVDVPDYEIKLALILREIDKHKVNVPRDIIDLIVETEIPNARDIIAIANSISEKVKTFGKINMQDVVHTVEMLNLSLGTGDEIKVRTFFKDIKSKYNLDDLKGKIPKSLVPIRNDIIKRLDKEKVLSRASIARIFGVNRALISMILNKEDKRKEEK
ncbi:MAG: DnaA/Hda family protein [archaeon]